MWKDDAPLLHDPNFVEVTTLFANNFEAAATALFVYDYFLTLPQEINSVWLRKMTMGSLLFLINRCVVMLNRGMRMASNTNSSEFSPAHLNSQSCNAVTAVSEICTAAMYLVFAIFSAIRTYAIWNKDGRVLIGLLVLGSVYPAIRVYGLHALLTGFFAPNAHSSQPLCIIYIAANCANIVFECIVIIFTWVKTVNVRDMLKEAESRARRRLVSYLLLRDGTTYFVAALLLHVLNVGAAYVMFAAQNSDDFIGNLGGSVHPAFNDDHAYDDDDGASDGEDDHNYDGGEDDLRNHTAREIAAG
ncbi:hypothetical protein BC835DRAFT_1306730 [Cytidiella melzeri]|nr:hypothetical protein BC835DRAFT_1306730 [Cytidiella melzeri]